MTDAVERSANHPHPERSHGPAVRLLALALVVAVGASALRGLAVGSLTLLWLSAAAALIAGLLTGVTGVLALSLGFLAGVIGTDGISTHAGVMAASLLCFGAVAGVTWRRTTAPGVGFGSSLLRLGACVAIGVTVSAATIGSGVEITGLAPFYVASRYAIAYLSAALVIGIPVWYVGRHVWLVVLDGDPSFERDPRPARLKAVTVIAITWFVGGMIMSIGYRSVRILTTWFPNALETRGLDQLLLAYDDAIWGIGGARVQAVFGGCMAVALVVMLSAHRRSGAES